MDKAQEIRERWAAVPPPPWRWFGYLNREDAPDARGGQTLRLQSQTPMIPIVMDFVRLGMQGGQPRFLSSDRDGFLLMRHAKETARIDHAGRILGFDNPVAVALENSAGDIDYLLAEYARLRGELERIADLRCSDFNATATTAKAIAEYALGRVAEVPA